MGEPHGERRLPPAIPRECGDRIIRAAGKEGETERTQGVLALRDTAILALFFFSGLRCAELVGLDLPDLDLETRQARVSGAGRPARTVRVAEAGLHPLEAYLDVRPECVLPDGAEPLFVSRKGGRLSTSGVRRLVGRVEAQLGDVPLHARACRHSHVTEVVRQAEGRGIHLYQVAEQAGHRDLRTTRRYYAAQAGRGQKLGG